MSNRASGFALALSALSEAAPRCLEGPPAPTARSESGGAGNGPSDLGQISADGERVAFVSEASNLVPGDRNEAGDVFLWQRASGKLARVNRPAPGVGADEADEQSAVFGPQLSADGRCVVYDSYAGKLTLDAQNGLIDVFISEAPPR